MRIVTQRSIPVLTACALTILLLSPARAQDEAMEEGADSARPAEALPEAEGPEKVEPPDKQGPSRTETQEEHTVVPGDNLWDLCGKYLNNPWYWPRVWSYNPEISNPHWIFPGQMVRFYKSGEMAPAMEVNREWDMPESVEPEVEHVAADIAWSSGKRAIMAKAATSILLTRDAFVTSDEAEYLGSITGSREDKQYLAEHDPIYIEFKNPQSAQVGQNYLITRTARRIFHPITKEFAGYYTRVMGVAHVVSVDEKVATAVITTSLDPVFRGDRIAAYDPSLTKNVSPKPSSTKTSGYILEAKIELTLLGERHLVFIDKGTQAGVEEGNVFDCVRREDGLPPEGGERPIDYWDKKMPIEVFGRILVVDARPSASTGIVVASLRELRAGDRVLMSNQ